MARLQILFLILEAAAAVILIVSVSKRVGSWWRQRKLRRPPEYD